MEPANAADDDTHCDVCHEPNRTGSSVVYVSQKWCDWNGIEWSDGLKMCIWCRNTAVHGGGVRMTVEHIRGRCKYIKRKKQRREARRELIASVYSAIKNKTIPW